MTHSTGRTLTGPAGTAVEIILGDPANPDQAATVAAWFLTCPAQSPAWDHYMLAVVHLRDVPGQTRPANIRIPHATHEILVAALDPDAHPTADDTTTWQFLLPINVSEQLELPDDAAAIDLLELAARAVLDGRLWAEPPLSGQVEPWRTALIKTAAHARGETHAP